MERKCGSLDLGAFGQRGGGGVIPLSNCRSPPVKVEGPEQPPVPESDLGVKWRTLLPGFHPEFPQSPGPRNGKMKYNALSQLGLPVKRLVKCDYSSPASFCFGGLKLSG